MNIVFFSVRLCQAQTVLMLHRVQTSTSALGAPGLVSMCEIKCCSVFCRACDEGYIHTLINIY